MAKSKGDARRSIDEGGIYLNNHRISEPNQAVYATANEAIEGGFLVLRKGRKTYHLVKVV